MSYLSDECDTLSYCLESQILVNALCRKPLTFVKRIIIVMKFFLFYFTKVVVLCSGKFLAYDNVYFIPETMGFGERAAALAEAKAKSLKGDEVVVSINTVDFDCLKNVSLMMMTIIFAWLVKAYQSCV